MSVSKDFLEAVTRHALASMARKAALERSDHYAAAVAFTDACEAFEDACEAYKTDVVKVCNWDGK